MYTGTIAKRYATALAEFSAVRGEERIVYDEAQRVAVCLAEVEQLREALFAPTLTDEQKVALIGKCCEGTMSGSMERFVHLVLGHRRERYLEFILHSFVKIYKQRHSIVDVELVSAAELDAATEERIAELVKEQTHCREIILHTKVDKQLIGGFTLRVDDHMIDSSIRSQLDRLRRELAGSNKRIL